MSSTQTINISTDTTPNPLTMKFIVNKLLLNGSIDFATKESAKGSPFAEKLYELPYVKGVFFASNFVTITKPDEVDWAEITEALKLCVQEAVIADLLIKPLNPVSDTDAAAFSGTDIEKHIQQILRDYVQPAVEQDGGAIYFKSFKDGVVTVQLKGSCSGCPSSMVTLKSGIEGMLKRMVPAVTEVVSEAA